MDEIDIIYQNEIGVAFFWKRKDSKIQVVFKDMGFYLSYFDLKKFHAYAMDAETEHTCTACKNHRCCGSILLRTPSEKLDVAVSLEELHQVKDLIGSAVFQLDLQDYLKQSIN